MANGEDENDAHPHPLLFARILRTVSELEESCLTITADDANDVNSGDAIGEYEDGMNERRG
jgi:hypothetical protein